MVGKVALTQNGNEYKKSNIGKIAGNIPAVAMMAGGVVDAIDVSCSFKTVGENAAGKAIKQLESFNFKGFAAGLAFVAGVSACLSVVGTAIGSVIDSHINKDRMAQADGEALRRNMPKIN